MDKLKSNLIFQFIFLALLIAINGYNFIYLPYQDKHNILTAPYGTSANAFRLKWHVPVIEKDMEAVGHYNTSASNKWQTTDQFPGNGKVLHIYKMVDANLETLQPEQETDAFRRKINDSVFEQLTVTHTFKADTLYKTAGWLFLVHDTGFYNYDNHERDLDGHGVDSVAKKWGLNDLVNGKR